MPKESKSFELSRDIERYLSALSKWYAQEGKRAHQQTIVNAQVHVVEEFSYDNLDGGIYGHALHLKVPTELFLSIAKQKAVLQEEIRTDLNKLHNVRSEFIDTVFLEMDASDEANWRQESGLLLTTKRSVSNDAAKRIWGVQKFRIFLSHKASAKKQTAELRARLELFGFTCFVAHADIHPTKAWQDEIENALASMDGFVALMTTDFHESDWTDQEVGYAFARGVPIIAVRLGRDPYGFIGKFQGVTATWKDAAVAITKVLIQHDRGLAAYIEALRKCSSWDNANTLSEALPAIQKLTVEQIDEFVAAYNENGELRGGWGINGTRPSYFGPGLVHYLNALGTRVFRYADDGIKLEKKQKK